MSFASVIGSVNGVDHEIVETRVLIRAFAEAKDETILIRIEPPVSLGPLLMDAVNVRIAIFEEPTGGNWDVAFSVRPESCEGDFIQWGPHARKSHAQPS